MSIIEFPTRHPEPEPAEPYRFDTDDHDRHAGPDPMDRRDREMWEAAGVEVQDDSRDECVTLPVRVGVHYGEPTIEIGRYSLSLDDAERLRTVLTTFTGKYFRRPA